MRTTNTQRTTFDKGDIVVHTDATFPKGAMVVDGYDETGRLLAHALGGGLQYTSGSHGIVSLRKVSDAEMKHPLWRESRFALEGVPGTFAGWTDGRLWNGWGKPRFEFDEVDHLLHSVTELAFRYDSAQDAFVAPDGIGEVESWCPLGKRAGLSGD